MQTIPATSEGFVPFGTPTMDKTRYLFFGTAGNAGNTDDAWLDESGHGNHLTTDEDDTFVRTTDAGGKTVYRSSNVTGGVWRFPWASLAVSDYTIYLVLRPNSLQNPYLLDAGSHSLALGFNSSDFGAYFRGQGNGGATGAGQLLIAGNELAVVAWRLTASNGGAQVLKNNTAVLTGGPWSQVPFLAGGALGHDYSAEYAPFYGDIHSFVFRQGNDTDAQVAETTTYLAGLAGMVL